MTAATPATRAPAGVLVDCDVHGVLPSYATLEEYLEPQWAEYVRTSSYGGPSAGAKLYPPQAPTSVREDWRVSDRVAASSVDLLRRDILDAAEVEIAILNPSPAFDLDQIKHPDLAEAYARAANDWTIAEWLDAEPRLRASIVLPARNVEAMIREIERVGGHPGFIQVVLPLRSETLYGDASFHPVLEAAVRNELVVAIHPGGFPPNASTPTGFHSYYVEELAGLIPVFFSQLTSLVAGGAFQRFPGLRVALLECGFTWLPPYLWRIDQQWRGLRREVPWLKRRPSATIKEHVRFSIPPLDAGSGDNLLETYGWLESDDLLMYASDYPHWHGQSLEVLLDRVGEAARGKILAGNARDFYHLGAVGS